MRRLTGLRTPFRAASPVLSVLMAVLLGNCKSAAFDGNSKTQDGTSSEAKVGQPGNPNDASSTPNDPSKGGKLPDATPPTTDLANAGWADNKLGSTIDNLLKNGSTGGTTGGIPSSSDGSGGTITDTGGVAGHISTSGGKSGPSIDTTTGSGGGISTDSDGLLWIPCKAGTADGGTFPSDFYGKRGTKIRVAGEFCPSLEIKGDLTIVFVLDHSGSMEGNPFEGPNDPTSGGTCGRLKSAQSLVKRYASMTSTNIKAGVVGFSNSAHVQLPIAPLSNLQNNLTSNVFCGSDSPTATTNYAAAFATTAAQLQNVQGTKLIYFISDGSPTTGGTDPHQAGLSAANAMRAIPNLTLYALFVGYKSGGANNPQGYMNQITGNPALVRITANADELARAAAALAQPTITINRDDTKATLDNPQGSTAVAIDRFVLRADKANTYSWMTAPIELVGDVHAAVVNQLTVTSKSSAGGPLQTIGKITFHEQPN